MKTLLVVISEKCNLDCSYCGVDKWSKNAIDPYLYLEEFRKMREEFPDEKIKIDFFGGEPLLQMHLIKTILDGVRDDGNVHLFMPTNGLLLTDEIVDWIIEENIEISLSFDGLWQDRNRLQLNGRGTKHRFFEKRELFKRIPGLRIHTMIYKGCYNLLENHLFIRDNFDINPELTLVRDVGVWDADSVDKLKTGIKELVDWYIEHPEQGMPFFIKFYLRHFLRYQTTGLEKHNCGAGSEVYMFSDNKIVPCTRFKDSPEMIEAIPQYAKMSVCQTCEVKNYCEKGCLFEQIKNQGPVVELCDLYKYSYREVSRMSATLKTNPYFTQLLKEEIENGN
jgi:sulfatase maturation enzyme AslB (radical SAM superfamily)